MARNVLAGPEGPVPQYTPGRQRERGKFEEICSKIANLKDRRAGKGGENWFVSRHVAAPLKAISVSLPP
jgi:hypothetical protein